MLRGNITSPRFIRWVFSIAFWFFLLVLPFLNAYSDGDTDRIEFLKRILPATLVSIPFFYINTMWLAKRYLDQGRMTPYFLGVLILLVLHWFVQWKIKSTLIFEFKVNLFDFRTLIPVLFISSMATLSSILSYLQRQDEFYKELKAEKTVSELAFLRSQISPHFIFNVLNGLVYLIRTNAQLAEETTIKLSKMIRYVLYESDSRQVVLSQEVDYLRNYIELQTIRFGEDVEIDFQIEGQFKDQVIEPMLLIPFVENAFKHGIGMAKDPFIAIRLRCESDILIFEVQNKITPEQPEARDKQSGIGLKNVQRRLELLYPHEHQLEINSHPPIFTVRLQLTLKTS